MEEVKKLIITQKQFSIAIMKALEANHSIKLSKKELDIIYEEIEKLHLLHKDEELFISGGTR